MTLFVGGPYHGKDLSLDPPLAEMLQLPPEDRIDEFWTRLHGDPYVTMNADWPHVYQLDSSTKPEFYRYVEQ